MNTFIILNVLWNIVLIIYIFYTQYILILMHEQLKLLSENNSLQLKINKTMHKRINLLTEKVNKNDMQ